MKIKTLDRLLQIFYLYLFLNLYESLSIKFDSSYDVVTLIMEVRNMSYGGGYGGYGAGFALIVVLFILLIIVGVAYVC